MARGEPLIRQWNLLQTLQRQHFGISTDELAERLECSRRQVQRDLKVLQEVGFPIGFEARDYGKRYWRLAGKVLESERLTLSVTEMISLYLSRQLLAPLAGTQFGKGLATALEKIEAKLRPTALKYFRDLDKTLFVKMASRHDYSNQDNQLRLLNQAIADSRTVMIRYHSASKGREWETEMHPYGLVFFGSNLYCIGYLKGYGEIRTLKINRIRSLKLTNRTFARPADFSLKSYLDGSFGVFSPGKLQTIKAMFTGWAATNVREQQWHPSQKILQDHEDHLIARFDLSETTEFKRWILGFGRHATVLSPRKLAKEIASELAEARAAYEARG